ncbi:hypothetical protein J1N35_034308 [Gossypium stocksii]|uniref:Uncharacterized protein n=1 Tax=Gossypium stocksii TaxID=47602 RepID=A0A9D3ZQ39_9ROSI|nr:hypothetical protein J1N35_034308 [Gossypium stocksii]
MAIRLRVSDFRGLSHPHSSKCTKFEQGLNSTTPRTNYGARAKQFKEAIPALVNQVWSEVLVGEIEQVRTSVIKFPYNILQTDFSSIPVP